MASPTAIRLRSSLSRYRLADVGAGKAVPEGEDGSVPYKGEVEITLHQLAGALRQAMGYAGARTIPELQANIRFHRGTVAGQIESTTHNIRVGTPSLMAQ
jgi:IMP dehydrogenase